MFYSTQVSSRFALSFHKVTKTTLHFQDDLALVLFGLHVLVCLTGLCQGERLVDDGLEAAVCKLGQCKGGKVLHKLGLLWFGSCPKRAANDGKALTDDLQGES